MGMQFKRFVMEIVNFSTFLNVYTTHDSTAYVVTAISELIEEGSLPKWAHNKPGTLSVERT